MVELWTWIDEKLCIDVLEYAASFLGWMDSSGDDYRKGNVLEHRDGSVASVESILKSGMIQQLKIRSDQVHRLMRSESTYMCEILVGGIDGAYSDVLDFLQYLLACKQELVQAIIARPLDVLFVLNTIGNGLLSKSRSVVMFVLEIIPVMSCLEEAPSATEYAWSWFCKTSNVVGDNNTTGFLLLYECQLLHQQCKQSVFDTILRYAGKKLTEVIQSLANAEIRSDVEYLEFLHDILHHVISIQDASNQDELKCLISTTINVTCPLAKSKQSTVLRSMAVVLLTNVWCQCPMQILEYGQVDMQLEAIKLGLRDAVTTIQINSIASIFKIFKMLIKVQQEITMEARTRRQLSIVQKKVFKTLVFIVIEGCNKNCIKQLALSSMCNAIQEIPSLQIGILVDPYVRSIVLQGYTTMDFDLLHKIGRHKELQLPQAKVLLTFLSETSIQSKPYNRICSKLLVSIIERFDQEPDLIDFIIDFGLKAIPRLETIQDAVTSNLQSRLVVAIADLRLNGVEKAFARCIETTLSNTNHPSKSILFVADHFSIVYHPPAVELFPSINDSSPSMKDVAPSLEIPKHSPNENSNVIQNAIKLQNDEIIQDAPVSKLKKKKIRRLPGRKQRVRGTLTNIQQTYHDKVQVQEKELKEKLEREERLKKHFHGKVLNSIASKQSLQSLDATQEAENVTENAASMAELYKNSMASWRSRLMPTFKLYTNYKVKPADTLFEEIESAKNKMCIRGWIKFLTDHKCIPNMVNINRGRTIFCRGAESFLSFDAFMDRLPELAQNKNLCSHLCSPQEKIECLMNYLQTNHPDSIDGRDMFALELKNGPKAPTQSSPPRCYFVSTAASRVTVEKFSSKESQRRKDELAKKEAKRKDFDRRKKMTALRLRRLQQEAEYSKQAIREKSISPKKSPLHKSQHSLPYMQSPNPSMKSKGVTRPTAKPAMQNRKKQNATPNSFPKSPRQDHYSVAKASDRRKHRFHGRKHRLKLLKKIDSSNIVNSKTSPVHTNCTSPQEKVSDIESFGNYIVSDNVQEIQTLDNSYEQQHMLNIPADSVHRSPPKCSSQKKNSPLRSPRGPFSQPLNHVEQSLIPKSKFTKINANSEPMHAISMLPLAMVSVDSLSLAPTSEAYHRRRRSVALDYDSDD